MGSTESVLRISRSSVPVRRGATSWPMKVSILFVSMYRYDTFRTQEVGTRPRAALACVAQVANQIGKKHRACRESLPQTQPRFIVAECPQHIDVASFSFSTRRAQEKS